MAQYFVRRGEKIFGPVTGEQVIGLARSQKIQPTDQIATDKNGPWQAATALPPLKTVFQQASAGPLGPVNADPLGIGPEEAEAEDSGDGIPLGMSRFDVERTTRKRRKSADSESGDSDEKEEGFNLGGILKFVEFFTSIMGDD